MIPYRRQGATGALLDEYERALHDLKQCILLFDDKELVVIADPLTADEQCRSVQTVLTHVVSCAYSYAVYIGNLRGMALQRPLPTLRHGSAAYLEDLDQVFAFTCGILEQVPDTALEEPDEAAKIRTAWQQIYDIEQMMEHAIVHVLRHRRQLEGFRIVLDKG
ncbi:DinB family protein [Taibaiella koreensis]|uniref:DinB family protein n=1 Tax=Taibaiella koreensis TaxID=1268548 RepID=UPI000E5A0EA2|nr:DinB family protein [Taibaiella koreensis]